MNRTNRLSVCPKICHRDCAIRIAADAAQNSAGNSISFVRCPIRYGAKWNTDRSTSAGTATRKSARRTERTSCTRGGASQSETASSISSGLTTVGMRPLPRPRPRILPETDAPVLRPAAPHGRGHGAATPLAPARRFSPPFSGRDAPTARPPSARAARGKEGKWRVVEKQDIVIRTSISCLPINRRFSRGAAPGLARPPVRTATRLEIVFSSGIVRNLHEMDRRSADRPVRKIERSQRVRLDPVRGGGASVGNVVRPEKMRLAGKRDRVDRLLWVL